MTPEEIAAVEAWIKDTEDLINSTGQHEGHSLTQIGRSVYCSCGKRVQGRIRKERTS